MKTPTAPSVSRESSRGIVRSEGVLNWRDLRHLVSAVSEPDHPY